MYRWLAKLIGIFAERKPVVSPPEARKPVWTNSAQQKAPTLRTEEENRARIADVSPNEKAPELPTADGVCQEPPVAVEPPPVPGRGYFDPLYRRELTADEMTAWGLDRVFRGTVALPSPISEPATPALNPALPSSPPEVSLSAPTSVAPTTVTPISPGAALRARMAGVENPRLLTARARIVHVLRLKPHVPRVSRPTTTSLPPDCGYTAHCVNYSKSVCPMSNGKWWLGGKTCRQLSINPPRLDPIPTGYVDGHWRRTRGGKMVWVKGHFRRL